MPLQPTHYALVIGIDDYPQYGTGGRSLKGAVRDADRFAEWLCDPDVGGGLTLGQNCQVIRSTGKPAGPLHQDIDNALHAIWTAARANGGDRFYLYFSGHGLAVKSDNVALCLANWSPDRRHAALSSESYVEFLKQCTPFREIIVFLDCCRLRQIGAIGRPTELGCAAPIGGVGAKRSLIGYATEFNDAAFEVPAAGDVRGHFTEALLQALWGGAAEATGGVTAIGLKAFLEANVEVIAQASHHKQIPQVPFDLRADTRFGSASPLVEFEISFSNARQGEIVIEAPDLTPCGQRDAIAGPWRINLKPGLYSFFEVGKNLRTPVPLYPTGRLTHVTF